MLETLLPRIIKNDFLHAKWLNTLSFMENCGARKIARCQHPTKVREEMLKHAAEEFRHAYHLKRQIDKIPIPPLPTYTDLLGGTSTLNYLNTLDLHTCRYLKQHNLTSTQIKQAAYILVTYAIEMRASDLYPLYHSLLQKAGSKITVKSILLEEEEHLNEMRAELAQLPNADTYVSHISSLENSLYQNWLFQLTKDVT